MTTLFIPTNKSEMSPKKKLEWFRRDLAENPREEWGKKLLEYISPDAEVRLGTVTVADNRGVAQVGWQHSMTAPGRTDGTLRRFNQRAPEGTFNTTPPPRRSSLARAESLTRRYVQMWKQGHGPVLDGLLKEICGAYWQAGSPITEDALRMLAAKSLQEAEARARR